MTLNLRRGYEAPFPPSQVNDSSKGSNGPAGKRSGKLHSEEGDGLRVAEAPLPKSSEDHRVNSPHKSSE